jgi:ribosomal protein L22
MTPADEEREDAAAGEPPAEAPEQAQAQPGAEQAAPKRRLRGKLAREKPARQEAPAAQASEPAGEAPASAETPASAAKKAPARKAKAPEGAEPAAQAAKPAAAPRRTGKASAGARRRVVRARARYVRTPARKARVVCVHLPGKSVAQARAILAFTPREAARDWSKLLESAVANAENNHELLEDDLIIREAYADEGPTIKRFRPRAMGRATPIRKRTSHLTITLSVRPEQTKRAN